MLLLLHWLLLLLLLLLLKKLLLLLLRVPSVTPPCSRLHAHMDVNAAAAVAAAAATPAVQPPTHPLQQIHSPDCDRCCMSDQIPCGRLHTWLLLLQYILSCCCCRCRCRCCCWYSRTPAPPNPSPQSNIRASRHAPDRDCCCMCDQIHCGRLHARLLLQNVFHCCRAAATHHAADLQHHCLQLWLGFSLFDV